MRGLSGGHALALKNRESRRRKANEEMMREKGLLDISKSKKRKSDSSNRDSVKEKDGHHKKSAIDNENLTKFEKENMSLDMIESYVSRK